ncbi:MAG: helix-turn-helix domain-containing protein [Acidimicrobiales bacterium]
MAPTPPDPPRPTGRAEVIDALKAAALDLVGEKGVGFSVREVADRAGVNQGLIYRHFGSKEQLIEAAATDVTRSLATALASGEAPIELLLGRYANVCTVLARLILDESEQLVTEHPIVEAMTSMAADGDHLPSRALRVSTAASTLLGWILFHEYFERATGEPPDPDGNRHIEQLTRQLLAGAFPLHGGRKST